MMPAALQGWLDGLAPRERTLVLAGAAVVGLALVYALLIQPVASARSQAARNVEIRQALLNDLEQAVQRHGPLMGGQDGNRATTDQSLVVLVDRTTRERNMSAYLKRNQPDGASGVRLRLENVPFDVLMEWLLDAESRYGLKATSVSFDPSGAPGRVHSNLVLSQA